MKKMRSLAALAVAAAFASPLHADAVAAGAAAESDKKVKFAEKEYDLDTGLVTIAFGDGKKVECNVLELSPEMQKQLMLHGASQKIGDSYAGAKGNFAEAFKSASDIVEQLKQGVWRSARGEGEPVARLAELAEAISRIKQVDLDKAKAAVEKATDEQRKGWRSNPGVKAMIAKLRAEKAAAELEAAGDKAGELEVDLT